VLGAFVLYAAAAVLSRDRNGRMLALATAYLSMAYHLNALVLWVRMAKETIDAAGPLLAEITATVGKQTTGHDPGLLAATVVARPPTVALVGIGWCLLLLVYFGGRNGRELYGLAATRS
jgi:hypothetical protein